MAQNPSNIHLPSGCCIACATGNGKGIAFSSLGHIPDNKPIMIFDPYGEYKGKFGKRKCHQYRNWSNFVRAFKSAWMSGKNFAISYYPNSNLTRGQECARFSELAWAASDGNRVLYVAYEEYGTVSESTAVATDLSGEIATGGRKFGLRPIYIFQRSAQVPKEIFGNCPYKIIGAQEQENDAKRIMNQFGCSFDDVAEIGRLNQYFAMNIPTYDKKVKVKLHYLKGQGLHDYQRVSAIVEPNRKLMRNWSKEQKQAHETSLFTLQN